MLATIILLTLLAHHIACSGIEHTIGQQQGFRPRVEREPQDFEYRQVLQAVERGIVAGDVGQYSEHFAPQVAINLRGGENGYFSSKQAYFILKNYFAHRRIVSFRFSTVNESGSTPFATGGGQVTVRGKLEPLQVYVSLTKIDDRWVVSQFNVY